MNAVAVSALSTERRRWDVVHRVPLEVVVFLAAATARLGVILRDGGLHGSFGYDAAVYFGASDAFVHGRMPYRDYVLLHPPGVIVALTPFAELTKIMSDESAFTIAVVSFALLGALNAVLVTRLCRRLGLGPGGVVAGGFFYAVWFGSVGAEYLTKLEPLGNLCMLLALLAVLRAQERGGARWSVLAGIPLGLALSVKIWWIVPVAGVLAWHLVRTRSARSGGALLAGAAAAVLAVDLPFFVVDPHAMWASVVQDQLGRHPNSVSPLLRIADLSTVPRLFGSLSRGALVVVALAFIAVAVMVMRNAWRVRVARPAVALLLVQAVVLFLAPSWFFFYTDYVGIAAALTVAAAADSRRPGLRRPATVGWFATAAAALITVLTLGFGTSVVHPFRGADQLTQATSGIRCIMSDSPMGQIELNALTRGLVHGCRNWIDVTGRTYGPDFTSSSSRVHNAKWQRDVVGYLRSGGAVIIVRPGGTGLDPQTRAAIARDGVIARSGGHTVYRVDAVSP